MLLLLLLLFFLVLLLLLLLLRAPFCPPHAPASLPLSSACLLASVVASAHSSVVITTKPLNVPRCTRALRILGRGAVMLKKNRIEAVSQSQAPVSV